VEAGGHLATWPLYFKTLAVIVLNLRAVSATHRVYGGHFKNTNRNCKVTMFRKDCRPGRKKIGLFEQE
jgi:hypothetical protein